MQLCFSPCPNDTFIFDAIVHRRIDLEGLEFDIHLADVEALNLMAQQKDIDFCKMSYHAYAGLQDRYTMCTSGSALGRGNGPLLISKQKVYPDEVKYLKIGIPGRYTTAAFLLQLAYPDLKERPQIYLFSDIEEAVLSKEIDAGVFIHEGRFTYKQKDLYLIQDLGQFWETVSDLPLPLGGIAMHKNVPQELQDRFTRVLKRSIEYALKHPKVSHNYVRQHAQEMDIDVCSKHIELFVNQYTVDLGEEGTRAVEFFLDKMGSGLVI